VTVPVMLSDPRVTGAVDFANSLAAGHVRRAYVLPSGAVDIPVVRQSAVDIAVFYLYEGDPAKLSDADRAAYDRAIGVLELIADNKLDLPLESKMEKNWTGGAQAANMNRDMVGGNTKSTFGVDWSGF